MIQEEWEENLRQFETMLSILIIPFFGRWYGRRFAYFGESTLGHLVFVRYRVSACVWVQRRGSLRRLGQSIRNWGRAMACRTADIALDGAAAPARKLGGSSAAHVFLGMEDATRPRRWHRR